MITTVALLLWCVPAKAVLAEAHLAEFECNRCHDGTELPDPPIEKRCVECHRQILQGSFKAKPKTLAKWQKNLHSLNAAPSLAGAKRLRPEWIASFLLKPHDVRPGLAASMPRLPISGEQAAELGRLLGGSSDADVAIDPEDVAEGRALYRTLRCNTCHEFSGAKAGAPPKNDRADGVMLAPDLAHVRARIQPAVLIDYLESPQDFDPNSKMPSFEIDVQQLHALAAFILYQELEPQPPPKSNVRLPALERSVTFDEVSSKVFKKVCWHCHSTPDYARGDGGPGNSGGFGYAARGLDLSSYEGIAAGSIGGDGQRRSVFLPLEDGTPRLLAVLLARGGEERGKTSALIGMPLGLPALTAEDIQLVESWIIQGRPR